MDLIAHASLLLSDRDSDWETWWNRYKRVTLIWDREIHAPLGRAKQPRPCSPDPAVSSGLSQNNCRFSTPLPDSCSGIKKKGGGKKRSSLKKKDEEKRRKERKKKKKERKACDWIMTQRGGRGIKAVFTLHTTYELLFYYYFYFFVFSSAYIIHHSPEIISAVVAAWLSSVMNQSDQFSANSFSLLNGVKMGRDRMRRDINITFNVTF